MNEELFKDLVRPVTDEDREKLPVFSYSKMDVYKNCPFQFDLKYNQNKHTDDTSIALEMGSLLHYVLEQKGKALAAGKKVDYKELNDIIQNGTTITDEKTKEILPGIVELRKKYWETFNVPDTEGRTYDQKLTIFDKVLHTEMEDDDWTPYLFEYPFEFVWDNRAIIHGFIDRIDKKGDEYRTIDYKTSKKVYDSSKLATSLQFGIYAMAIYKGFGALPSQSNYRFILLDETQSALTKGWEKRLIKALTGIFDKIDADGASGVWKPSPSPLCYWCNFCAHNPNAYEYKNACEYYSLWEPNNKTYAVNKEFTGKQNNSTELKTNEKRKLIF